MYRGNQVTREKTFLVEKTSTFKGPVVGQRRGNTGERQL